MLVYSGLSTTCGTRGFNRLLKPLMIPTISTRRWLVGPRHCAAMVALSGRIATPAVRMAILFKSSG